VDPRARPALLSLLIVLGCGTESFSNQPPRPGDAGADGTTDATSDGGTNATDAGSDAPVATGEKFFCQRLDDGGSIECALGAQVCCVLPSVPNFCVKMTDSCASGGGEARPYGCLTQSHCPAMGLPGHVCCAFRDATDSYVDSVACVPPEQCRSPHVRACGNQPDCFANTICQQYNAQLSTCQ
jgi:hypothetical protein